METKTDYDAYFEPRREALATYLGATFLELREIANAFAQSKVSLPMLMRMVSETRGFDEAIRAFFKRRPYQDFNSAVFDADGVRMLLRSEVELGGGAGSVPYRRTLLECFCEAKGYLDAQVRNRMEEKIERHVASIQNECGKGLHDPLLGLVGYHSPSAPKNGVLSHWTVPVVVPMFETVDLTFERLYDAMVNNRDCWRSIIYTRKAGLGDVGYFQPNVIKIIRVGLYESSSDESLADVQRWMEQCGVKFASYECFAALRQYPDILRWIDQNPKGGWALSAPEIWLPTIRTYHEPLEADEVMAIYIERGTRYVPPVAQSLHDRSDKDPVNARRFFPYVLPPDVMLYPQDL